MGFIQAIRQFCNIVSAIEIHLQDSELDKFAERAYARCVEWFGLPRDPDKRYEIVGGLIGGTTRDLFDGHYIIVIPKSCQSWEQRVAVLSHEMYHRVTMRNGGLLNQLWVDEMLAAITELRMLRMEGLSAYADFYLHHICHDPTVLSANAVRTVRPKKNIFLRCLAMEYPEGFYSGVSLLGTKLEQLVGWEQMCRIVHCRTWDEWLAPLPVDLRSEICDLLALPSVTRR